MPINRDELLSKVSSYALTLRTTLRKAADEYHRATSDVAWAEKEIALGTANAALAKNLIVTSKQDAGMHERVLSIKLRELDQLALEVAVVLPDVAKKLRAVSREAGPLRSPRFANWDAIEAELTEVEIEALQAINAPTGKIPGLSLDDENNVITWKGTSYSVEREVVVLFAELIEKYPEPIKANELFERHGFSDFRWGRIKPSVPKAIAALVLPEPHKGTRLVIPT